MAELIVVDDDPAVLELLAEVLAADGHGVRQAADGGGLRRLIAAAPADNVGLDHNQPDEDGGEDGRDVVGR